MAIFFVLLNIFIIWFVVSFLQGGLEGIKNMLVMAGFCIIGAIIIGLTEPKTKSKKKKY
ncbi:MAG: hypothetical protein IKO41_09325 [Lachnospiraceae bacterium]|nr:hypothetical protein [Lachnospiraceae bacterium]